MDREVDLAASAEILDVAVPPVFRTTRDRTSPFGRNLGTEVCICRPGVGIFGQRRQSNDPVKLIGSNEIRLSLVPRGQDFSRGRTAEDAGVDEAGELDTRNVA